MHFPFKVVLLACFLLVGYHCLPQPSDSFEKLTVEDGLSQGYVSTILQDQEGFLWIGTRSGLNRFDGYEFKVYDHAPLDSFSMSGNVVLSVTEMDDFLLVSTIGNGLNVFDKKTERFTRIIAEGELSKWLQTGSLAYASLDMEGNLWARIKTQDQQYYLLQLTFEKVLDGRLRVAKHRQWPFEDGFQINMSHKGGHIWGGNSKDLFRVNLKSGELDLFEVPSEPRSVKALNNGSVIFIDNEKLALFNGKNWRWKTLDYRPRKLMLTNDGNEILVSSKGCVRDRISVPNILKYFDSLGNNEMIDLGDCEITCAFVDDSGLLWMGTNGYGLIKLDPRLQQFNVHLPTESIMSPVLVDKNGRFQFATNRRNDWAVKTANHALHNFPYPDNPQVAYQIDPKGNEWALSFLLGQLELFRKKTIGSEWERLLQIPGVDSLNIGKQYNQFSFDGEGNIWIAHQHHLKRFNPENGALRDFSFQNLIPNEHETNALTETADGSWWLATEFGLLQAKPNGGNLDFKLHQSQEGQLNHILNDHVSHLLTDTFDPYILWIATLGGGVSKLDVRNLEFKHITLPDKVIYAIYPDGKGCFWMSSNQGIIRFDPRSGEVKNYTVEDGLPTIEFNRLAHGQAPDGTIFFGSVKGLVSFHPDEVADNPFSPMVRFTGLEVNNQQVKYGDSTGVLSQTISFTKNIELPFDQNSLTLEFAGMEYSAPTKNKFRYYLKGVEKEWAHESTERRASYLNLPPGKYTFLVKGCNSDAVWHEEATMLKIVILPPWWRSTAAYVGYFLLLASMVYGTIRFFLNRQKLQHRIALEAKEAERLKELDAFKTKLYTNITHEFRTPLTVINGMAEELEVKEEPIKRKVGLIRQNGEKLLQLVNQMLDLAKLEERSMSLRLVEGDVVMFLKYLVSNFQPLAERKNITLHFRTNAPVFEMPFDKEHVQTTVTNLLSNALKFTPEGGEVEVKMEVLDGLNPPTSSSLKVTVSDTGVGIPAAELPYIFDRFYRADTGQRAEGSGIGLAFVKELVEHMGGEILVESEVRKGTKFTVSLPSAPSNGGGDETADIMPPLPLEGARGRLLIVEDNADVAEYLLTCVTNEYQVLLAQNGQQGIDMALEHVPDLIVSDVMMPEKNGFELLEFLKNDERTSHIPIILLTAKTEDASRIKGLERGADAYLSKPFNKEELLVRLRKLLELRKKLQERYGAQQFGLNQNPQLAQTNEPAQYEDAYVLKIQTILDENLEDENFGVKELCAAMGVSRTQLHNKIKALTGKSTTHYIRFLRLQKAKHLLLTSDKTVSEVAFEVGFRHLQHFSTSFADEFGMPPSKVRG